MPDQMDAQVRAPEAYSLARRALDALERHRVWPTPLNYELWMHVVADPQGALASEVARLIGAGEVVSDAVSEDLAARFLPRPRLNDQIRDAGDQLQRHLESIARAVENAQTTNETFGRALAGAQRELDTTIDSSNLRRLVDHLAFSTTRVHRENGALERRLSDSTQEVRQLREHLEQVRRDSMTDALTLLANRKAFDEALNRACAEADAHAVVLTLAMLDIDHFKVFNDTWGHQTGDQVIRYVGSIIGQVGAAPRLSSRYGGEEFAVLFPAESVARGLQAVEAIRKEISSRSLKRRSTNDDLGVVTVSAGVAQRRPGESAAELLERTDAALYVSKRAGRNRTTSAESATAAAMAPSRAA
jgi:diguanylate cyclase